MKFFKNKENVKQLSLGVIAVLCIFLGVANYNDNKKNEFGSINENDDVMEVASRNVPDENLGDVELVSSTPVTSTSIVENDGLVESEEDDDYFKKTLLERDKMYSETIEVYQDLINNDKTPETQKAIAAKELTNLTSRKNSIMIAENLIKNKGIEDVVILENTGRINVIVKTSLLNKETVLQIQNIIQKELNVDISNISISEK